MKKKAIFYISLIFGGILLAGIVFFVLITLYPAKEIEPYHDTDTASQHLDESIENTILRLQIESEPAPIPTVKTPVPVQSCSKPKDDVEDDDYFLANVSPSVAIPEEQYIPTDLVQIPKTMRTAGFICLRKDTEVHLADMFEDAKEAGLTLYVTSGFRSFEKQESILDATKAWKGDDAYKSVALPGHSEHQLGVAVDLSGKSVDYSATDYDFGETVEGKWLAENSYKYGFVLSYPEDKEDITGYIYEPWHFRYVGIDLAKEIYDSGKTIVEYLAEKAKK